MGIDEAVTTMRRVDAVRHAPRDRDSITEATRKISRLRAWLDGCEAELAAAMVGRSPLPARDIADAGRVSERAANRVIERADTASSVPELGDALAAGDVSGGHIDAVTAGVKSLEPAQRQRLRKRAGELAGKAAELTADEFKGLIQAEARKIMDDDGIAHLERQKRACRLRTWTSSSDGMWCLSGRFDPETGLSLAGRLNNMLSKLFAEPARPDAPTDPGERTEFLRAMALVKLTEGGGGVAGRPEIVVVVDARTDDHGSAPSDSSASAPTDAADSNPPPDGTNTNDEADGEPMPAGDDNAARCRASGTDRVGRNRGGAEGAANGRSGAEAGGRSASGGTVPTRGAAQAGVGAEDPAGARRAARVDDTKRQRQPAGVGVRHGAGGRRTGGVDDTKRQRQSADGEAGQGRPPNRDQGIRAKPLSDGTISGSKSSSRSDEPSSAQTGRGSVDGDPNDSRERGSVGGNASAATATGPHVDWGLPVELPWGVLRRMVAAGEADIHAIVVRNGVVLHAPGRLDLGRTTRLANHAQRRALRALYPTCAVPGCCVRFEYTEAHHVIWWERGGRTDFINLLPLCSKHHHLVHSDGWHLHLDQHRNLTITLPDGSRLANAPPKTRASAA